MINLNEYSVVKYGDDKINLPDLSYPADSSMKRVMAGITKRDWAKVRELLCPIWGHELTEPKRNSQIVFCHQCRIIFCLWKGK